MIASTGETPFDSVLPPTPNLINANRRKENVCNIYTQKKSCLINVNMKANQMPTWNVQSLNQVVVSYHVVRARHVNVSSLPSSRQGKILRQIRQGGKLSWWSIVCCPSDAHPEFLLGHRHEDCLHEMDSKNFSGLRIPVIFKSKRHSCAWRAKSRSMILEKMPYAVRRI